MSKNLNEASKEIIISSLIGGAIMFYIFALPLLTYLVHEKFGFIPAYLFVDANIALGCAFSMVMDQYGKLIKRKKGK